MRQFRHRGPAHDDATPAWQDKTTTFGKKSDTRRYLDIPEIDRWRATPFDMPPDPVRAAVLQRVGQLVQSLDGAIDEGTGAALDRLIECWVAAWIHVVEVNYADHCAVINVHWGQASQWLVESARGVRDEDEELGRIRGSYLACRSRLSGEPGPEFAAAGTGPQTDLP